MLAPRRDAFQGLRNQVAGSVSGLASRKVNAQQEVPLSTIPTQNAQVQSLMIPPELQSLHAMGVSYQLKLQNDSFLQGIRQQQEKLGAVIEQRRQDYINSVQQFFNTAPPELRQFLNSPRVIQDINISYANSQQLQPEFAQMFDLNKQYNEYVQTNYGEEQKRLQELQQQLAPQIEQYQNKMKMQLFNQQQQFRGPQGQTQPTVRNEYDYLPEGLTQEQFMKQVRGIIMDQRARSDEEYREYFKPYYDSYLKEKATTKQIQPVQQPTVNPIVDPIRPITTGPKSITPVEQPTVNPIVDPIRTPTFRPPTPLRVNPIKQEPVKPIVDPIRTPIFKPPTPLTPKEQEPIKPIVDPIKTPAPVRNKYASSQYQNLNTNVKGLMR